MFFRFENISVRPRKKMFSPLPKNFDWDFFLSFSFDVPQKWSVLT